MDFYYGDGFVNIYISDSFKVLQLFLYFNHLIGEGFYNLSYYTSGNMRMS